MDAIRQYYLPSEIKLSYAITDDRLVIGLEPLVLEDKGIEPHIIGGEVVSLNMTVIRPNPNDYKVMMVMALFLGNYLALKSSINRKGHVSVKVTQDSKYEPQCIRDSRMRAVDELVNLMGEGTYDGEGKLVSYHITRLHKASLN